MNPQDVTLFFDGFAERFSAERAALIATGFLRGSKALDGVTEIDLLAATAFWRAFADGVAQRGKAQLGDKTVLDVLDLIATALENAAGQPLPEALRRAEAATAQALEATKGMVAQHGKAAAFREKSRGLPDTGGTVARMPIELMRGLADDRGYLGRKAAE